MLPVLSSPTGHLQCLTPASAAHRPIWMTRRHRIRVDLFAAGVRIVYGLAVHGGHRQQA